MKAQVKFQIEVRRYLDGYVWVDNAEMLRGGSETALYPKLDVEPVPQRKIVAELYEPLKTESGLFQTFANLEPTKDAILAFANQFGQLCGDTYLGRNIRPIGVVFPMGYVSVDPFHRWTRDILTVRHWLTIWNLILARNGRGIVNYLGTLPALQEKERVAKNLHHPVYFFIEQSRPILEAATNQRIDVARRCLCEAIGRNIRASTLTRSHPEMRLNPVRDQGADFTFHGGDLATAIWVQFGFAIAEDKKYGFCEVCGKPFEISPQTARTNRVFCGVNCRLRAYRKRQKEAIQMHKQGKKLKQIADALKSDVPTVKGWIAAAKEKEE